MFKGFWIVFKRAKVFDTACVGCKMVAVTSLNLYVPDRQLLQNALCYE